MIPYQSNIPSTSKEVESTTTKGRRMEKTLRKKDKVYQAKDDDKEEGQCRNEEDFGYDTNNNNVSTFTNSDPCHYSIIDVDKETRERRMSSDRYHNSFLPSIIMFPSSTSRHSQSPSSLLTSSTNGWICLLLALTGWIVARCAFPHRLFKKNNSQKKTKGDPCLSSSMSTIETTTTKDAVKARKREFLSRVKDQYGYRDTKGGYVDDWRPRELPNLILPVVEGDGDTDAGIVEDDGEQVREHEVYLDYAGSALPTRSQLQAIYTSSLNQSILANPHSTGPAASRTMLEIQQIKKQLLEFFHATPGRFAGMRNPPVPPGGGDMSSASPIVSSWKKDTHPGYDLIFTSGTTEALRIVAERFPWSSSSPPPTQELCCRCKQSILVYPHNAHTSVIGMRGPAQANGATFRCLPLEELLALDKDGWSNLARCHSVTIPKESCSYCSSSSMNIPTTASAATVAPTQNLVVLPAECNFGGTISNVKSLIEAAAASSSSTSGCENFQWSTMIDLAKAASTTSIDLCDLNPDFACLSFYKIFGEPTGLGALFVKRSSIDLLTCQDDERHNRRLQRNMVESNTSSKADKNNGNYYFGGGSVDMVLANRNHTVPRSQEQRLSSLVHGSVHFRGIASLRHGLEELDRVGGMLRIHQHTRCLTWELSRRLKQLRHSNGRFAIGVYGAWGKTTNSDRPEEDGYEADNGDKNMRGGPTIAFNVIREDGSHVGYNEVSKLAALNQPPIQFRTGCLCNPGGCQEALELTDDEIIDNYETAGHVCGDHVDIINGRPTGAIRVSIGKDSIWEDIDVLVTFLDRLFVSRKLATHPASLAPPSPSAMPSPMAQLSKAGPTQMHISELYIFPIKSCAAQRVKRWKMDSSSGRLAFDREFALVDTSGTAMRLQSCPKMGKLRPVIDLKRRTMTVSAPGCDDLILELDEEVFSTCTRHGSGEDAVNDDIVKVCGNNCCGRLWGGYAASEWFSSFLGVQCWLARSSIRSSKTYVSSSPSDARANDSPRPTSMSSANERNPNVAFANEQPLLLITQCAVDTLNKVLSQQNQKLVSSCQFRPNLVVKNENHLEGYIDDDRNCATTPLHHVEDNWSKVSIMRKKESKAYPVVDFHVKGNCARCAMVDLDPSTLEKGKTLKALASYRRQNGQINFGIFLQGEVVGRNDDASTTLRIDEGPDQLGADDVWIKEGDTMLCSHEED